VEIARRLAQFGAPKAFKLVASYFLPVFAGWQIKAPVPRLLSLESIERRQGSLIWNHRLIAGSYGFTGVSLRSEHAFRRPFQCSARYTWRSASDQKTLP